MRPTHGPAPIIIAQALELGILCRPTQGTRVCYGEALEVSGACFWLRNGHDSDRPVWHPTPADLLVTWELITLDLIREEWRKSTEDPF